MMNTRKYMITSSKKEREVNHDSTLRRIYRSQYSRTVLTHTHNKGKAQAERHRWKAIGHTLTNIQ